MSLFKEVLEQFDFLYVSAKKEYKLFASKEANAETFKQKSVKNNAMYYYLI